MKTKVALGLSVAVLLTALITTVITSNVNAQYRLDPALITTLVKFTEDPLMHHGRKVVSYYAGLSTGTLIEDLDTVPPGKKYIITDIVATLYLPHTGNESFFIKNSSTLKFYTQFIDRDQKNIHLNSGIEIGENQVIQVGSENAGGSMHVLISGYYVDI